MTYAQTDKTYQALQSHYSIKEGEAGKDRWEYYILDFKKDQVGILRYIIYTEHFGKQTYTSADVDGDWTYYKWHQRSGIIQIEGLSAIDDAKSLKINGNGLASVKNRQMIFTERGQSQPADMVIGKTYALNLYGNDYSAFSFDKKEVEITYWKDIGTKEKVFIEDETEKSRKYKWVADGDYILILGFEPWNVAIFKNNMVVGLYDGKQIPLTLETRKPKKN